MYKRQQLPYSTQVEVGGEGTSLYDWEGRQVYGKLLRVELKEGDRLNLAFGGSNQEIDTVIEVYRENSDGFSRVDTLNYSGHGESGQYLPEEAGTYYLAFLGYAEDQTGLCDLKISVSQDLEEGFQALTCLLYTSRCV